MAQGLNYVDVLKRELLRKTKGMGIYVTSEDYYQDQKELEREKEWYKEKYDTLCKSIAAGVGLLANGNAFEPVSNK